MEIGKGWNGQRAEWRGSLCRSDGKITVGVCAREKKARSKHMEAITSRLSSEKFEVGCVYPSWELRGLSCRAQLFGVYDLLIAVFLSRDGERVRWLYSVSL